MPHPRWLVRLLQTVFPYRYSLARLTHLPLLGKLIDLIAFHDDRLVFLPADRVIIHEQIQPPGQYALPSQIVEAFIDQAAACFVMDECICRVSDECDNYPRDLGCLFLGEAALKISPRLGHLVSREEAKTHIQRARKQGLMQLVGRDRIDSVWLGAHPGRRLLTICNCCPCCCIFRFLPDLDVHISQRIESMPGISVQVTEACIGCGECSDKVCFVNAIQLVDGLAVIGPDCRGCGHCVEVCPQGAIELVISRSSFVEDTLNYLSERVKVD